MCILDLSGNLKANTIIRQQASISSDSQTKQSKISDNELNTISVTVNQLHQDMDKMKEKVSAVKEDVKTYTYKSEESIQRMEVNVESAFKKAMDAQKSNEELQASSVDVKNQLSLTQKQLLDVQKDKEHLQSQISLILDKLSHAQQQMSDMQKSNEKLLTTCEKLQATNVQLQDQLSLTQQQLLGVQSMMTCSRLWVVSHDQFTIGREIGRGAWATVHEATFRGATVAAKRLHQLITAPRTRQLFQREMEMALHCQHQNIVTFLGATLEGPPVILMELMDTNLRSAYEQGQIRDHQVLQILHDVASALHFLHTRPDPVIHRDVSSANVLLKAQYNGEWLAKLGDLGTAKLQRLATTAGPGAIVYGAPEASDASKHSPKMDVYSFGVLIVEILTKTLPFEILTTLKDQVQQQFSQYHQLVTSCTNQQSSDRPTMYDVIHQLNIA